MSDAVQQTDVRCQLLKFPDPQDAQPYDQPKPTSGQSAMRKAKYHNLARAYYCVYVFCLMGFFRLSKSK